MFRRTSGTQLPTTNCPAASRPVKHLSSFRQNATTRHFEHEHGRPARLDLATGALRSLLPWGCRSALASRNGAKFLASEIGADRRADLLLGRGGGAGT